MKLKATRKKKKRDTNYAMEKLWDWIENCANAHAGTSPACKTTSCFDWIQMAIKVAIGVLCYKSVICVFDFVCKWFFFFISAPWLAHCWDSLSPFLPLHLSVSFTRSHSMVRGAPFQTNACTLCTFFVTRLILSLARSLCRTVHFAFYSCSAKRHKTK